MTARISFIAAARRIRQFRQLGPASVRLLMAFFLVLAIGEARAQGTLIDQALGQGDQEQTSKEEQSQSTHGKDEPAGEAQKAAEPSDAAIETTKEARAEIKAGEQELATVEKILLREGLSDTDLSEIRNGLTPLIERGQEIAVALAPNVQAMRTRLEQLGPAPEGDATESEAVAAERADLQADLAHFEGLVSQARLLATRAQQLADRIAERRRELFSERIFERGRSAADPRLWYDASRQTFTVAGRFWSIVSDWMQTVYERFGTTEFAVILLSLAIIGGVIIPARRLLLRFASRDPSRINPGKLRRTTAAAWLVFVYAAVPTIGLLASLTLLRAFDLLTEEADLIVEQTFFSIIEFSIMQGIVWALFAPNRPTWRIATVADAPARRIVGYFLATAAVYVVSEVLDEINAVTFAPLNISIARQVLSSLLTAAFIGLALRSWTLGLNRAADAEGQPEESRWSWLIVPTWLAIAAIPLAALFGFPALSNFIAFQLVIGGTILFLLYLALLLIDSLLTEGLASPDSAGSQVGQSFGLKQRTVAQIGIIASGILRVLVTIIAVSFLLVPWGIESKDVFGWVRTFLFGFTIGDLTISFSSIFLALGIFVIGWVATRAIQKWLDQSLLPQTKLDSGVRNSVKTAFGYAGLVIAAAIAVTYVGLDMSNLALVAGALSVGIGFGLQSVVNNFVSGLILLVERPIKNGDWIVVGGEEGFVRKISVRSTEIETFDRASVIIPNSDLISGTVKNWMHIDKLGRIIVPVGVDYGADPEQVRDLLMKCAQEHPALLRRPAPQVLFVNFGESSLDFELRAFVGQIDSGMQVRSDLRYAILKTLREANIGIPFPQRDLNFVGTEKIEEALASLAKAAGEYAKAPRLKKRSDEPPSGS